MRFLLITLLVLGCQRSNEPPVTIIPDPTAMLPDVPTDPFGTPGVAYDRLRETTDAARANVWDGNVDTLAAWLEEETRAIEQSLGLMRTLRLGATDVYSVANGRIALVYEHIASTLTEAEALVRDAELDQEWVGQEALLWQQANGFWARCARGCGMGGPYLDVWELRCQAGEAETLEKMTPDKAAPPEASAQEKADPENAGPPPRQAK